MLNIPQKLVQDFLRVYFYIIKLLLLPHSNLSVHGPIELLLSFVNAVKESLPSDYTRSIAAERGGRKGGF